MRRLLVLLLAVAISPTAQAAENLISGHVFHDRNGNGFLDGSEAGIAGVKVSDGTRVAITDARGVYKLNVESDNATTVFVIKPAGYSMPRGAAGLPQFALHLTHPSMPTLRYGGMPYTPAGDMVWDFALLKQDVRADALDILVFGDPQPKTAVDVGYYERDIVQPLIGKAAAELGLSLGDIVHDDLSLYPALNAATAKLKVPWLHVPGNHDLDFDASRDEDSLLTFRDTFGADTFAWEEALATFIVLDDVIYTPLPKPDYIGGFRAQQFAFLETYLPTLPKDRLLVLSMHIPLFDTAPDRETFRRADRELLFALLKDFPHVLVLSAHAHTQRHFFHDAKTGWQGAQPLHEYNVGAACGAFWSGVKDAAGIPDTTMADGTPNGYARLKVKPQGAYKLSWHPARDAANTQIALHAPKVLRRGSWAGSGVFANVFMGRDDTHVEYRIDDGEWKPMNRVAQPDPRLLAENLRDDASETLRGYDRAPDARSSPHLWRGGLPTDLAVGEHRIEVRAFDVWQGEQRAQTRYRLDAAKPE